MAAASAVGDIGSVRIAMSLPLDMVKQEKAIAEYHRAFGQLSSQNRVHPSKLSLAADV